MASYLLDSNIIIDVLNGKRGRGEWLANLTRQRHVLACCPINVTEVYAGMRPHEERPTSELLQSLQFYAISFQVARLAGELQNAHSKKGISLATADVTIAAVAIYYGLTLVTDNVKHYPMKEIKLYKLPN